MIVRNNPFGDDPVDILEENAAKRVGDRIKHIRVEKGLTQAQLGEKVGLSADRIQKYENGARKPKIDMLKRIADALGVSSLALIDPVPSTVIGAIYALFEMESVFSLRVGNPQMVGSQDVCLIVKPESDLYEYLKIWREEYNQVHYQLEATAPYSEERKQILHAYSDWEWNFPRDIVDMQSKELEKQRLKSTIKKLQQKYDELNKDEG